MGQFGILEVAGKRQDRCKSYDRGGYSGCSPLTRAIQILIHVSHAL